MKPIWRVFGYIKHYITQLVLHVVATLLHVVFNLSSYVLIIPFLELIFGLTEPPAAAPALSLDMQSLSGYMLWHLYAMKDSMGVWNCLLVISAAYLAMSLLSNLFRYLAQLFVVPIRNGIVEHLRNDVYNKITILPISFFNSRRRGDILSRISNDLAEVEWSVVVTIVQFIKDPLNILFFSVTLLIISPKLFLCLLVVVPLAVWLIGKIGGSLKRNATRGQTSLGGLFALLEEGLGGIRVIKSFGREEDRQQTVAAANEEYTRRMGRVVVRRELSGPLSEVLATLVLAAVLVFGGYLVTSGEMLSSVFIFFVLIFLRLVAPVQSLVHAYSALQKGNASAARFFQILDADERILQAPDALSISTFNDAVEYRNVSFAYTTEDETKNSVTVLNHINLRIERGRSIAIVGPSGAGKTTMVDLLPRFYDCTEGEIAIDGHPIKTLDINALRSLFGEVSQQCILFNDTVANNIAFGHREYSREQIEAAARMAYADEFIRELPEGYDTMIGDRGMTLSGGQRQRISIARAILKDPPILIFDEATSALDAESERAVQRALDSLKAGRTTIMIAHRLSTIQNADEIIVMDKGEIVECGTHAELIAHGGLYKHLVDTQTL